MIDQVIVLAGTPHLIRFDVLAPMVGVEEGDLLDILLGEVSGGFGLVTLLDWAGYAVSDARRLARLLQIARHLLLRPL